MGKRLLLTAFTFIVLLGSVFSANAGPGDTTVVYAKDTLHWSGYGGYYTSAEFPDNDKSYQRIWMKTTLGCPDKGCSQWDYTTKFAVYDSTGRETYLPDFKVAGSIPDSFKYQADPVYQYIYAGSTIVDSVEKDPVRVTFHNMSPDEPVRTENYWRADRYIVDTNQAGQVVDSHYVQASAVLDNRVDTIYGEPIEIGRAATPYSGRKEKGFFYPWYFDVTDYQELLKGDQRLRAFYRGPRDGFTISFKFIMIEGTPPRDPVKVQNLYKSPATGWYYSFDTSDINNDRFVQRQLTMPQNAEDAKIRMSIKGHGFGEAGGNCAEFCKKWYRLFVNGNRQAQQTVWRNDCDLTPVYPQTGTWIYSRTNWCPGTESYPYDHDISDLVDAGEDFTMEVNMQPHNFIEPNRDFTDPRWVVDGQFIAYGPKNFDRDIAITRILSPNDQANQDRYNPTCGNPAVVIENRGANPITSATIKYGAQDREKMEYQWNGDLSFMKRDTVQLPSPDPLYGPSEQGPKTFEVSVSNPNGQADEYKHNNEARSTYQTVNEFPGEFRFRLTANDAPGELSYVLRRKSGEIVRQRSSVKAEQRNIDTFDLSPGCYEFILRNAKGRIGAGDGLSFFANNESDGSATFLELLTPLPIQGGVLEPNFGRQVRRSFTVGCSEVTAGFSLSQDTNTVQVTDTSQNAGVFRYTYGDGEEDSTRKAEHTFTQTGQYKVCQIARSPCDVDSVCKTVTVDTIANTAVPDQLAEGDIEVYPNPVKSTLNIQLPEGLNEPQYQITNSAGQTLLSGSLAIDGGKQAATLDGLSLKSGAYFLRLQSNEGEAVKRFIVE